MKSAATNTISEVIQYDYAGGAVSKPIIKTEYYSDTASAWKKFEDVESRTIELSNENKRYQSYSFLPPSKILNLTLNNFEQIYATGSGDPKASILKKNLLVRCWSGYEFATASPSDESDDLTTNTKFYHTIKSGSTVILDSTEPTGTFATAAELGSVYGTAVYGSSSYSYPGYYTKTFDLGTDVIANNIDIETNHSLFSFKYRASEFDDFHDTSWSAYRAMNSGANVLTLGADINDNYFQFIVRFEESSSWDEANSAISNINLEVMSIEQLFKQGTFIIDDPKLEQAKVQITGRDYLRKALETEINLSDLSGNVNVETLVTKILDRSNIPYDTATWDQTSTTISVNSTIAESLNNVSAWKALDYSMDALNAGDNDWRFRFNEDGEPELKTLPTDVEADWTVHYHYNIESITKSDDSEKQLQRVTAMNKNFIVNPEGTLADVTGTASSSLHLTYASAVYVRYTDVNSVITSETARGNTGITFATNTGSAYDIKVFGCTPKNALTDEIYAEKGNSNNIINNEGSTYKNTNPFFNQIPAQKYVDYIISQNSDPKKRIETTIAINPLIELQDNLTVFDLYTYSDDIYGLVTIKESWSNPGLKQTLVLKDRGFDLGAFIWDRNGKQAGVNDLKYSTGLVWSQDLPIGGSDTASYITTKEKQFA